MLNPKLYYIKALDGLRAIAITLVLIWHYFTCQVSADALSGVSKGLWYATCMTWSGVDLFFVLSGFLIGRIILVHKKSDGFFKSFYLRRFYRIFPPYYLILFLLVMLYLLDKASYFPWLTEDTFPWYSYAFYIQNFWMESSFGPHWLGVTWSLAIEEQFYILLPLVLFFTKDKFIPWLCVILILFAPICRAMIPGLGSYVLLPARMDSLLVGVLIAYFYLRPNLFNKLASKKHYIPAIIILLTIVVYYLGLQKLARIGGVYIHSVLALIYGLSLIYILSLKESSFVPKILSHSILSFLARISYMVYLSHQIFAGIFHQLFLNQSPRLENRYDFMVNVLALTSTILFSAISYKVFEKPILGLGRKYKFS